MVEVDSDDCKWGYEANCSSACNLLNPNNQLWLSQVLTQKNCKMVEYNRMNILIGDFC